MQKHYRYNQVEWGEDAAEADKHLKDYFVETPEYNKVLSGKLRIITGRKGAGKTAILSKIKSDSDGEYNVFVKELSLKDFPLQDLRQLKDNSQKEKHQFVPIWTFLILVDLISKIIFDESVKPEGIKIELLKFLKENFNEHFNRTSFVDTISVLKKNQSKISLPTKLLSFEDATEFQTSHSTQLHYQKATTALLEHLEYIQSDCTYYFLFDELDEGYKVQDEYLNLLITSLLRATTKLVNHFKNERFKFRPVIALRKDIYENLEDNDQNKYDDYILRLSWNKLSLKNLVNQRIYASLNEKPNPTLDPWRWIVHDQFSTAYKKNNSVWDYIYYRTLERPRDIIKYLKYSEASNTLLTIDDIRHNEGEYSNWLYQEFRDEIHSFIPVWKECFTCISRAEKGLVEKSSLIKELENDLTVKSYLDKNNLNTEKILEILFDFSVIGYKRDDRIIFKYQNPNAPYKHTEFIKVHSGLYEKLCLNTR